MTKQKVEQFFEELRALLKKYNVGIIASQEGIPQDYVLYFDFYKSGFLAKTRRYIYPNSPTPDLSEFPDELAEKKSQESEVKK